MPPCKGRRIELGACVCARGSPVGGLARRATLRPMPREVLDAWQALRKMTLARSAAGLSIALVFLLWAERVKPLAVSLELW